jgi:hypothetical protein
MTSDPSVLCYRELSHTPEATLIGSDELRSLSSSPAPEMNARYPFEGLWASRPPLTAATRSTSDLPAVRYWGSAPRLTADREGGEGWHPKTKAERTPKRAHPRR